MTVKETAANSAMETLIKTARASRSSSPLFARASYWEKRSHMVRQFAWAVPCPKTLDVIAKHAGDLQVLEIGSGRGLWAALLQARGVDVMPTDMNVTRTDGQQDITVDTYTHVHELSHTEALERFPDCHALMLVWPPYNEPMAAEALSRFKGDMLIYVGEDSWGCTGDKAFHEDLAENWECVENFYELQSWDGIHDSLYIYRRNK
jgi:hypothetical protein